MTAKDFVDDDIVRVNSSKKAGKNNTLVFNYLSDTDTLNYHTNLKNRVIQKFAMTTGKRFLDEENIDDLLREISDWFDTCLANKVVPTTTNLALWLGIDRRTLESYANKSYTEVGRLLSQVKELAHNVLQGATITGGVSTNLYTFLSKNFYGMKDDKTIALAKPNESIDAVQMQTLEVLKEQLKLEESGVIDADVVEEK